MTQDHESTNPQHMLAKHGVDYHHLDIPALMPPDKEPTSRWGSIILGGCVFAVVAAVATSVFAGPIKTLDIGVYVEMVGVDVGYVIEYHNDISYVVEPPSFTLSLDDVEVVVSLQLESLEIPDVITVVPPLGWYCEPCSAVVEEGTIGQVFVYPEAMS